MSGVRQLNCVNVSVCMVVCVYVMYLCNDDFATDAADVVLVVVDDDDSDSDDDDYDKDDDGDDDNHDHDDIYIFTCF